MKLSFKKKHSSADKSADSSAVMPKRRRKTSKKLLKVISVILVIAIAGGSFFAYKKFFSKDDVAKGEITALAQRGSVSSVIEGSGTLQALEQYEITSLKKGEVTADYFEEGDIVKEGDILYRMDDEDGYDVIDNSLDNIDSQKSNVEKSKTSLETAAEAIDTAKESVTQAEEKLSEANKELAKLNVRSKVDGVISALYINKGDSINANGKIADIYDNSKMILEIQFLAEYVSEMTMGSGVAHITLSKNGTSLEGVVTKIASGTLLNSVGASVTNVEITVENPGAIEKGDYATAEVDGYACSSEGTFKYYDESSIVSEVSGKVENFDLMVGDRVRTGDVVAVLSNDSLQDSIESAENSVKEANRNLTSKERSYKEANQNVADAQKNLSKAHKNYNDALESLEDYIVRAPISGTIIQKNIKAGENLETSNTSGAMAIIADLSSIIFEMSVDELDISKLEVGMDVEVTADAIENVTFAAKVTGISIVGTSNNGVTSYPVKITLNPKDEQEGAANENYDKLIPGMNVSASVVIERVEDVIVVPVSAVRRGNIVIISEDSDSEGISMSAMIQGNAPGRMARSDGAMPPSDGMPGRRDGFASSGERISSGERPSGRMPMMSDEKAEGAVPDSNRPVNDKSVEDKSAENKSENKSSDSKNTTENSSSKADERLKAMMESLDIPDGYKAIMVETGLSDESFIEIKQGLSEGDKVLLPDSTRSEAQTAVQGMMPGGMMGGGMPGGMMGGGMPRSNMGGMSGNRSGGNMGGNRTGGTR